MGDLGLARDDERGDDGCWNGVRVKGLTFERGVTTMRSFHEASELIIPRCCTTPGVEALIGRFLRLHGPRLVDHNGGVQVQTGVAIWHLRDLVLYTSVCRNNGSQR
jgi:hypothetical protein